MLANKDEKVRPILADMHMNGVYFDAEILKAYKAIRNDYLQQKAKSSR